MDGLNTSLYIHFETQLTDFITKLKIIFPLDAQIFERYETNYMTDRVGFVTDFVKCLSVYEQEVMTCNEVIFCDQTHPVYLMNGIDFRRLWVETQLSSDVKKCIFQYLQILYLIGVNIIKSNGNVVSDQTETRLQDLVSQLRTAKSISAKARKQSISSDIYDGYPAKFKPLSFLLLMGGRAKLRI
jgi:hypothetical protein